MLNMDIPSNSEIYLVLSNLITKIEGKIHNSNEDWLVQARDLRDRMMASDLDSQVPPAWVDIETCPKCGGACFFAAFNSKTTFSLAPQCVEFRSTNAVLYPRTLNIEFDNRRVRVGAGQTMRRWFKHEEICGLPLSETTEFLKPAWLATYKPVDKEASVNNLKEILDDLGD